MAELRKDAFWRIAVDHGADAEFLIGVGADPAHEEQSSGALSSRAVA